MKFLKYLLMIAFISIAIFALSQMSHHAQAADITWDGGGSNDLASTPANWVGDALPSNGDNIIFDSTSDDNCILNVNTWTGVILLDSGYDGIVTRTVGSVESGVINIKSGSYISDIMDYCYQFLQSGGYCQANITVYATSFLLTGGINIGTDLIMSGTGSITTDNQTIYSLTITSTGTITQTGPVHIGEGGYYNNGVMNRNYAWAWSEWINPLPDSKEQFTIWMILIFFLILTIISFAAYAMHIGLLNIITLIIMMIAIPLSNDLWTEYWPFVLMFGLVNAILVLMTWMRK